MVFEVYENKLDNITNLLMRLGNNNTKKEKRKTLADIYGKLKRGLDGLEYQKTARYGND